MKPIIRAICLSTVFLAGGPWIYSALAQESAPLPATLPASPQPASVIAAAPTSDIGTNHEIADWTPVSEDTLDDMRGGFDLGNGLVASFGIDRAVYVNGDLVTTTSFNIPDVSHITTTQAAAMNAALNSVSLTQVGPNNTFNPGSLSKTTAGTVIQNTLNNQNIQSITTINASVNSLNAFRQANFQSALQQAELQSLGH
ncbi:hypothetical protein ISN76_13950 [Dyella halodurans]|uniref:Uncharacterized protein n=1 Tax=Dyella halodurans TaxID=1920171 RepID=A0ABV9C601_9GAMM|nr:hypothetical protein [Dyella halodurans]